MADTRWFYADRLAKFKTPAERMGYVGDADQQAGFAILPKLIAPMIDLKGLTVHDAGCGLGQFSELLWPLGVASYVGTDCMAETLEEARVLYPRAAFWHTDLLTGDAPEADVTFIHGALAFHGAHDVEKMLERLWARSRRAMAFRCWWRLPKGFHNHDQDKETRRLVEGFMRRSKARRIGPVENYGVAYEAAFALVKE